MEQTPPETITTLQRVNAVVKRLSYVFPETPTAKLMLAIIDRALTDATTEKPTSVYSTSVGASIRDKDEASSWLKKPTIEPAELCGVSTRYVRRCIREAGLAI